MLLYSIILSVIHALLSAQLWLLSWIQWLRGERFQFVKPKGCPEEDKRQLRKLPLHIAFQLKENRINYQDVASMVVWSSALGITYITVFDSEGVLKRNEQQLMSAIDRRKVELLGTEQSSRVKIHVSMLPAHNGKATNVSHVRLASLEDGRSAVIACARHLCTQVSQHQRSVQSIDVGSVHNIVAGGAEVPDPDLLVSCGPNHSLFGFLPWQIRLTEIMTLPSHRNVKYMQFLRVLHVYAGTEQRCGV